MGGIFNNLMPAATAATGGLMLDVLWGYAPIPGALKTGPMRHVAKAAGAIGLGMLAGMVVSKATADRFATGALTIVMHDAMRDIASRAVPALKLGEYDDDDLGYWGSGYNPSSDMGLYMDPGMGEYMNGADDIDL
jgi:hypothetical protein